MKESRSFDGDKNLPGILPVFRLTLSALTTKWLRIMRLLEREIMLHVHLNVQCKNPLRFAQGAAIPFRASLFRLQKPCSTLTMSASLSRDAESFQKSFTWQV